MRALKFTATALLAAAASTALAMPAQACSHLNINGSNSSSGKMTGHYDFSDFYRHVIGNDDSGSSTSGSSNSGSSTSGSSSANTDN